MFRIYGGVDELLGPYSARFDCPRTGCAVINTGNIILKAVKKFMGCNRFQVFLILVDFNRNMAALLTKEFGHPL